ncbi:hypothetical protein RSAG8_13953, partial [Rhizoctonia solani AG-8 WAC10335]
MLASLPPPTIVAPPPLPASEPHIIRIGTSVPQEGPQVICVTSPSLPPIAAPTSVVVAPPVSEPPHVVCIGGSAPQEGPPVICVTSPKHIVAPALPLPGLRVIHVTVPCVEPASTAPPSIDPATSQPTIMHLSPS